MAGFFHQVLASEVLAACCCFTPHVELNAVTAGHVFQNQKCCQHVTMLDKVVCHEHPRVRHDHERERGPASRSFSRNASPQQQLAEPEFQREDPGSWDLLRHIKSIRPP